MIYSVLYHIYYLEKMYYILFNIQYILNIIFYREDYITFLKYIICACIISYVIYNISYILYTKYDI